MEEVITNQSTNEFQDEVVNLKHSSVIPVSTSTAFEETEIILGESEMDFQEVTPFKSNIINSNVTEIQTVITSCIETIDRETELEKQLELPKHDAVIEIVPFNATMNSEIIATSNVDILEEKAIKTTKAMIKHNKTQKYIEETEVVQGEKELDLKEVARDFQEASQQIIEMPSKIITEVQITEKEAELNKAYTPSGTHAQTSVSEQQPLYNTEIILSQNIEDLCISKPTTIQVSAVQGTQEAVKQI